MSIPNWYELVLLSLAAWRTYHLFAWDTILDPVRWWVKKRRRLFEFLTCPFCSGFWIALAWWGAWQAWEHGTTVVAAAVAVTALVPLIENHSSSEE